MCIRDRYDPNFLNFINVFEDNSGALVLASHGNFSGKRKHNEVAKRFVFDYVEKNFIQVTKVASEDNTADILTKSLGRTKFELFRKKLNIY